MNRSYDRTDFGWHEAKGGAFRRRPSGLLKPSVFYFINTIFLLSEKSPASI